MIRRKIESENIQNDKNIIQQKENAKPIKESIREIFKLERNYLHRCVFPFYFEECEFDIDPISLQLVVSSKNR